MRPMLRGVVAAITLMLLLAAPAGAGLPAPFNPDDPGYPVNEPSLVSMGVDEAWSLTQGDPAVVIAVIDSGTAPNPDFDFVPGRNLLDNDSSTQIGRASCRERVEISRVGGDLQQR